MSKSLTSCFLHSRCIEQIPLIEDNCFIIFCVLPCLNYIVTLVRGLRVHCYPMNKFSFVHR